MSGMPPTRRDFLKRSGQALGGAWLMDHLALARKAAAKVVEAERRQEAFRVLSEAEVRELEAVAEQIVPATDTPGARDAGVGRFMDVALDSFAEDMTEPLRSGLDDLQERTAEARPGTERFSDLPFDEQTELLRELEETPFFQSARFLTVVGMFSLPSRGGNRDGKGWEVLGFEERPLWRPPFGYYDERYREEVGAEDGSDPGARDAGRPDTEQGGRDR